MTTRTVRTQAELDEALKYDRMVTAAKQLPDIRGNAYGDPSESVRRLSAVVETITTYLTALAERITEAIADDWQPCSWVRSVNGVDVWVSADTAHRDSWWIEALRNGLRLRNADGFDSQDDAFALAESWIRKGFDQ